MSKVIEITEYSPALQDRPGSRKPIPRNKATTKRRGVTLCKVCRLHVCRCDKKIKPGDVWRG